MCRRKGLALLSLVFILIILFDQALKFVMIKYLAYGTPIRIINGFFSLTLVFNAGAAFGLLAGRYIIFLIIPVFTVILGIILFIASEKKESLILPLGLLLGGTAGNFIDRLHYGWVVDFFDFYWHSFHWPAFNLADISICAGITLLIWQIAIRNKI